MHWDANGLYSPSNLRWRQVVISLLLAAVSLGIFGWAFLNYLVIPRGQAFDFYVFWVGGRTILSGQDPYTLEATRAFQLGTYGYLPSEEAYQHVFAYPAHIAVVLFPFVALPFRYAVLLWMVLQIPLFMASLYLGLRLLQWRVSPFQFFCLLLLSLVGFRYPMIALVVGQLTILVLFCIIFSSWLYQRNYPVLAAICLAGVTIRPDLALVILMAALALTYRSPQRSKFWGTLAAAGGIMALIPMLFVGFWPVPWVRSLLAYTDNPNATWPPGLINLGWARVAFLALCAGWAVWVLRKYMKPGSRENGFWIIATIVLAALLMVKQTGSYNLTFALVPAMIGWYFAKPAWLKWLYAFSVITPWIYYSLGQPYERGIFLVIPLQYIFLQELNGVGPAYAVLDRLRGGPQFAPKA